MSVTIFNAIVPVNIDRIIDERGLKRRAVAKRAGFSEQQFSDMLNGRRIIKPCDVLAVAKALDVAVGELFERHDDQNSA